MKNLTFDLWKSFDLPTNLFYLLYDKYQGVVSQPQPSLLSVKDIHPSPESIDQNKEKSQIKQPLIKEKSSSKEQESSQDNQKKMNLIQSHIIVHPKMNINTVSTISSNNSKEDIKKFLGALYSEINNIDTSREVFKTIHTIFTNITTNPQEQKYKKISIEKIFNKWPYQSLPNFLKYCGFKSIDNQYMILMDQSNKSFSILPEINLFIISKSNYSLLSFRIS